MANTYTNLHYHIVFSTKNRDPFLDEHYLTRMHEYLGGCLRSLDCTPIEIGGVADHTHLLARMKPTHCVADVMRSIKKGSSEWIRSVIPKFHWQDGYSAFTVSRSQIDRVRKYIAGQAEHHRTKAFADEYRELLLANGIDFDERFLL